MRQIILDTETTGLEPAQGHRIIEIGCVELKNRKKTDTYFHQYLNPEREIEDGAYDVHGLSNEFLSNKPLFRDVVQDLINFIRDSEVIIHNAAFDEAFIDAELDKLGPEWGSLQDYCKITDTLKLAREKHPGQKNSLDALCLRYGVDNSQRDVHGALLDAQILADVYLAMTGGQATLSLDDDVIMESGNASPRFVLNENRGNLKVIHASEQELAAHQNRLDALDKESDGLCIWRKLEQSEG